MPRFFLEMVEDGHRLPCGSPQGYLSFEEAKKEARRRTDDALPRNTVRVLAHVATAHMGGDGEPYSRDEE